MLSDTGEPCSEEVPPPQSLPQLENGAGLTDDVDGDGYIDIVMHPIDANAPPIIHWGAMNGDFGESQALPFASLGELRAGEVGLADLDGDGDLDVLRVSWSAEVDPAEAQARIEVAMHIAPRDLAGTDPGSPNGNLQLGDFDGDGRLDMCVVNLHDLSVFRGLDGVAFAEGKIVGFPEFEPGNCQDCNSIDEIRSGDFDGDGIDELAVSSTTDEAWIIDDLLAETPKITPLEQWGRNVGDFDADGCDDILATKAVDGGPLGTTFDWTLHRCPLRTCE